MTFWELIYYTSINIIIINKVESLRLQKFRLSQYQDQANCLTSNGNTKMLKGQILAVILYTACLTGLSEQATLTCAGTDHEVDMPELDDVRVVDGYQRSGAEDFIFLGSDQNLTVIDGDKIITGDVGVCYSTAGLGCYKSGADVADCDNFIRGVTTLGGTCNSSSCRILVCGTNAMLPRCTFCNYDGSMLDCSFTENDPPQDLPYIPNVDNGYSSCTAENIDGQGVFQNRKNDKATFLYHVDRLYYGLAREASSTKSIIGLASVTSDGVITGKVITRTDSEKMVANDAQFVGRPFVSGDFVYFLFREPAQELASLSAGQDHPINAYYSRIARICKNDAGADVSSTQTLTSFLKQRLVCSKNKTDSLEYNEIQDFALSDDGTMIHAIFTNEQNAAPQSALCVFDLTSIDETFNTGSFFGADGGTNNDLWRVYAGTTVSPRPGLNCNDPNTADTNFERDYNLMSDRAEGTVQFFLVGDRFSNLEMTSESGTEIYIISSEKGCLYKVEVDTDNTETDLGDPCQVPVVTYPIKDLELLTDNGYLVTTAENVNVLSDCSVYQAPNAFPPSGTYLVPPNSIFEIIYDTMENGLPSIMSNGTEITDSNDEAYRLLKNESLDYEESLVHLRILILDENTTVMFTESNLAYTIKPYDCYTENEYAQRCIEWEAANKAYSSLKTCVNGPFSSNILLDNKQVQSCENCAYNDCTSNNECNNN